MHPKPWLTFMSRHKPAIFSSGCLRPEAVQGRPPSRLNQRPGFATRHPSPVTQLAFGRLRNGVRAVRHAAVGNHIVTPFLDAGTSGAKIVADSLECGMK